MNTRPQDIAEILAKIAALPEDQQTLAVAWTSKIEDRDAFYFYLGKMAGLDQMHEGVQEAMTLAGERTRA